MTVLNILQQHKNAIYSVVFVSNSFIQNGTILKSVI